MCALMGSLSLDIGQGSCNKVSFPKRVSSSLPTMNSDTCCSVLVDELVRRTDNEVGYSHSNFEKSSVQAGWLANFEKSWRYLLSITRVQGHLLRLQMW